MRVTNILFAASLAAISQAEDLATVLAKQPSLSTLVNLLGKVSNTTSFLASQESVTLFAPSDDALASIVQQGGIFSIDQAAVDPGLIEQILRYHLYRGVIKSEDITEIPEFVSGYLNYSGIVLDGEVSGSNVTGGQVVGVSLDEGGNAIVTSGLKETSQVVVAVCPDHLFKRELAKLTNAGPRVRQWHRPYHRQALAHPAQRLSDSQIWQLHSACWSSDQGRSCPSA